MLADFKARAIAFYLPQYHPIPENDKHWGKGFTEWTNVTKAKPLYRGHPQPRLPADLGFYDLRVPEVREQQAALAQQAGIEGFCYWHYWFGNGRRALEQIFDAVVKTGKPEFPFCLAWANESWSGRWHGLDSELIIEQKPTTEDDCVKHFYTLLEAFKDKRYIRINDRLLFIIYFPKQILNSFTDIWQKLANREGLPGFYFIGFHLNHDEQQSLGYQATLRHGPNTHILNIAKIKRTIIGRSIDKICAELFKHFFHKQHCTTVQYSDFVNYVQNLPSLGGREIPVVVPNWDNTPRCGNRGCVLASSHPSLFEKAVLETLERIQGWPEEERLIFIKSWNEWAEGNYIEPDQEHGWGWINALRNALVVRE